MQKETYNGWCAVKTVHCKEMEIADWLRSQGFECFVPMTYKIDCSKEREKRVLVPAVHNYLFVRRIVSDAEFEKVVSQSTIPFYVIKSLKGKQYAVISDAEMTEFRMICDPDFSDDATFMSSAEADIIPGHEVEVIKGPWKGTRGKLARIKGKHFFIKAVIGMGVMLHISRWYCRRVKD